METFTTWHVILLLLTAVFATFLAWLIVQIIYRKSQKEMRRHQLNDK